MRPSTSTGGGGVSRRAAAACKTASYFARFRLKPAYGNVKLSGPENQGPSVGFKIYNSRVGTGPRGQGSPSSWPAPAIRSYKGAPAAATPTTTTCLFRDVAR